MRFNFILLFILLTSNLKAQSGFDSQNLDSYLRLENYLTKSEDIDKRIDYSCAVFISPSEAKINEIKNECEQEDDFYIIADDNIYYAYTAAEIVSSLKIKTIDLTSGTVKFTNPKNKENWTVDTEKVGAPGWNIILYKPGRKPAFKSSIDLSEAEVKTYFGL
ncbi:MAG: hypothetical protein CMO01_29485 [Thalassobius sp.]|nr:hypothetical protein [Thalassovita sp.]|tara:strand:- start:275 stop:760 length:486 start_codon:yes stop_codon:yes gene_type:complete